MPKYTIETTKNLSPSEQEAIQLIVNEYDRAITMYGPFASAHEGYSVLLEEVDELWDEVKAKQSKRNPDNLKKESIQVAAMGMRFLVDVILKNKGFE